MNYSAKAKPEDVLNVALEILGWCMAMGAAYAILIPPTCVAASAAVAEINKRKERGR